MPNYLFRSFLPIAAASLSAILSATAGTISGSFTPIAQGDDIDLTAVGKTDWVHWGLYTQSSINRKWGVPALISDFSVLAPNGLTSVVIYQFSDNANSYTWYDGWPVTGATNSTTGVWAYEAFPLNPTITGYGFEFTVPADNTTRQLQVFVGAFQARGQLKATLSDGGTPYTDTTLVNTNNGPGGVYDLSFRANSPGQTLTVQWTVFQRIGINNLDANVTLQAAALNTQNANNPPFPVLTSPAQQAAFPAATDIPFNAEAQDFDGSLANVSFFAGPTFVGQDPNSPYAVTWNNAPAGRYLATAAATDNQGANRSSQPHEFFVYSTGGTLSGTTAFPPATADLTSEGTADWVHWGMHTNTSIDRKSGVSPLIQGVALGSVPVLQYTDNYTSFAWSDGTPTQTSPGTTTGIYITGLTNGFQVTAPADTSPRTLRLYVGGYGVQAAVEAFLSDNSAAPFVDASMNSIYGNLYALYTLTYAAASPGQQLIFVIRPRQLYDFDYGNVTLQAATLEGAGIPPGQRVLLINPLLIGTDFSFSFATESGHNYLAQYAADLAAPNWQTFATLPGTGGTLSVTNSTSGAAAKFYRVQTQ